MPGSNWCLLKWLVGRGQGSGVNTESGEKTSSTASSSALNGLLPPTPVTNVGGGKLRASIQVLVASCPELPEGVSITGFCRPSEFPQARRASL